MLKFKLFASTKTEFTHTFFFFFFKNKYVLQFKQDIFQIVVMQQNNPDDNKLQLRI
jgi:hypothetical protein